MRLAADSLSSTRMVILAGLACLGLVAGAGARVPVVTIEITEKVLVEDTLRLGINLGDDAYYSGAALVKKRVQDAFAHPVVFDGRLYLRYHDTLYCYDVKKP